MSKLSCNNELFSDEVFCVSQMDIKEKATPEIAITI